MLRRGQIVNGRYRVEDVLGHGGMGVVMSAQDLQAARRVALKVPHRVHAKTVARLTVEAMTVDRLTSNHAARLYEAGTFVDAGGEVPFLALEYLDGVTLATWLGSRGALRASDAAAIVLQACDAIGEAHDLGLVHRDIKPANLMLTSVDGALVIKVLDFGIAWVSDARLTVTGDLVGSPSYMAPERLRPNTPADPRSDVWSLGAVLYEALADQLPFTATELPQLCLTIMLDEPAPLPATVPADLAAVVMRCLAKEPERRYANARELADALRGFAATPAISTNDLELASLDDDDLDEPILAEPPRSRRKRYAVALAAVAVLAIAIVILSPTPTQTQAPTIAQPVDEQTPIEWSSTARLQPVPVMATRQPTTMIKREVVVHEAPAPVVPAPTIATTTPPEAHIDPLESPF